MRTLKIGDTFTATDVAGHRRVYTVRGFYADGYPKADGFSAPHAADCPCSEPGWDC